MEMHPLLEIFEAVKKVEERDGYKEAIDQLNSFSYVLGQPESKYRAIENLYREYTGREPLDD